MEFDVCPECGGSGDCSTCYGSGLNVAFNSSQKRCPQCGGSGKCIMCRDAGIIKLGLSDS